MVLSLAYFISVAHYGFFHILCLSLVFPSFNHTRKNAEMQREPKKKNILLHKRIDNVIIN